MRHLHRSLLAVRQETHHTRHMRKCALLLVALLWPAAAGADTSVLARWTQLGPGGIAEERAVTNSTVCPRSMTPRAEQNAEFSLVCVTIMERDARNPRRIVVLGDTGCRIKPPALQDCNDPTKWPFPVVAASAAKLRPDLVIHVGDYLYRESACPVGNAGCAGTSWGDNWPTWSADFFTPAAPLLAAAPWIFVRGNHEECSRAGVGYTRLLAPVAFDPATPCNAHLKPFAVPVGPMSLVVMDDAAAPDTSVSQTLMPDLKDDFASLGTIASRPTWLLMHRPIWGLVKGPFGIPVGGNLTMMTAVGDLSALAPVELMLAGHIHTFEVINYAERVPPQILAGHGGDNLDPTPLDLGGAAFQGNSGVQVKDGLSVGGFGFLLMTKSDVGWTIDLYRVDGTTEGRCAFANGRIDCTGLPGRQQ